MDGFKHLVDTLSKPTILVTFTFVIFFFIFPPTDWFEKWHRRLKFDRLWSNKSLLIITVILVGFFVFGLTDSDFRAIMLKPDNVPISGLIFLVFFFTWLSMSQAYKNDDLVEAGKTIDEHYDAPNDKVLVWPDLVYVELISLILFSAFMLIWSIGLAAPIEEPANPSESPNPAKAPWYFLGLQEMLVYFDPWIAGIIFPMFIIIGMMAIPYMDINKKGDGYYSFKERRVGYFIFMYGWFVLWVFLIVIGTIFRGPNWNFYGPFEWWDPHKLEALTNVNLSEYVWIKLLNKGLPSNIFVRESIGFIAVIGYMFVMPLLLAKTKLKHIFEHYGPVRYATMMLFGLTMFALPIKMYLRWIFNLKYIISIPEWFFNI